MTSLPRPRFTLSCLCFLLSLGLTAIAEERKPNVLFIAVDDLRPQLGCYGFKSMHTPNIDRLAAQGTVFERAYCMVPTCGASRASLMSGIRPSRNRFVNYLAWAEKDTPGITTLNTQFKNSGYYTVSNGKIFHHPEDNAIGWSEPAWRPKGVQRFQDPKNQAISAKRAKQLGRRGRGPAFESADVADDVYADGKVLEKSLNDLRRLAKMDKPFFLATGFFKPHLPFVAPKKYWDLYDRKQIRLPATYHRPKDAPAEAIHNWGELRNYANIPRTGPLSDEMALTLIHGYYACVSYTDAHVGKLLAELERLGLNDNTIVVLWGDHGWNLGEHTLWCKHCSFETSMHAPLIVKVPGIKGGKKTRGLTEFIDIYPSLCELAGITPPKHLDGRSFVPLLKTPDHPWKTAAVGRYRNGDTIRTDQFRFTEFTGAKNGFISRMLYDHEADPAEDVNISEQTGSKQVVESLTKQLHEGKGKDRK